LRELEQGKQIVGMDKVSGVLEFLSYYMGVGKNAEKE
jgi:hypothetical protein